MSTVLIADDDHAVREMLETKFTTEGLTVIAHAGNGVDAVRLALHHRPDVAVIDLLMPWVNGFDAIREITAASPETRIVVFSILEDDEDRDHALELGADVYLRKGSTTPNEIAEAVRSLLGSPTYTQ